MDTRVKPAYDTEHEVRRNVYLKQRPSERDSALFFVLSKTLGIMLLPTNFLIGIGLLGALLLATRFASLGRKLLIASVVLLAICGFSPLGNWVLYPLQSRFPPWDPARAAPDGIAFLALSVHPDHSPP